MSGNKDLRDVHQRWARAEQLLGEFIAELAAIVTDPDATELSHAVRGRLNHALAMATTERELAFWIDRNRR